MLERGTDLHPWRLSPSLLFSSLPRWNPGNNTDRWNPSPVILFSVCFVSTPIQRRTRPRVRRRGLWGGSSRSSEPIATSSTVTSSYSYVCGMSSRPSRAPFPPSSPFHAQIVELTFQCVFVNLEQVRNDVATLICPCLSSLMHRTLHHPSPFHATLTLELSFSACGVASSSSHTRSISLVGVLCLPSPPKVELGSGTALSSHPQRPWHWTSA